MRKYSSEDQKNLTNLVDELLTEGLFDRLKARGSQAVGALKGAKDVAKGIGYGIKSGFDDSGESFKKSREFIKTGMSKSGNAKIDSYLNTIDKKLESIKSDIMSDLSDLSIDIPANQSLLIDKAFDMLGTQLSRALTNLKYSGEQQPTPTNAPVTSPTPKAPTSTPASKPSTATPAARKAPTKASPAKKAPTKSASAQPAKKATKRPTR